MRAIAADHCSLMVSKRAGSNSTQLEIPAVQRFHHPISREDQTRLISERGHHRPIALNLDSWDVGSLSIGVGELTLVLVE